MYDAFLAYREKAEQRKVYLRSLEDETLRKPPEQFYYLTCHREENTNDDRDLTEIFKAMDQLDAPVVYPVHPRNKQRAVRLSRKYDFKNLILAEPVGYLESLYLVNHAKKIVTDSGGLQREAFFAGKQCVTLLDFICWPETMVEDRNQLAKPLAEDILDKLTKKQTVDPQYQPFGDGNAAEKIVRAMEDYLAKE